MFEIHELLREAPGVFSLLFDLPSPGRLWVLAGPLTGGAGVGVGGRAVVASLLGSAAAVGGVTVGTERLSDRVVRCAPEVGGGGLVAEGVRA